MSTGFYMLGKGLLGVAAVLLVAGAFRLAGFDPGHVADVVMSGVVVVSLAEAIIGFSVVAS